LCGRKEAGRRWKELGSSDFVLLQEEIYKVGWKINLYYQKDIDRHNHIRMASAVPLGRKK
jgi:hypothetical protein